MGDVRYILISYFMLSKPRASVRTFLQVDKQVEPHCTDAFAFQRDAGIDHGGCSIAPLRLIAFSAVVVN